MSISIQRKLGCPLCCFNYFRNNFVRQFSSIVKDLDLKPFQKKLIMKRYVRTVAKYLNKSKWTGRFYHSFRCTITSFSILVPALLTLQKSTGNGDNGDSYGELIYWSTWGLSLGVTLLNGIYQLYSLDQTYFKAALIQEKLRAEGWHYVALSGKYSIYRTHQEGFVRFMNTIERLKMKYVQYMFLDDQKNQKKNNNNNKNYIKNNENKNKEKEDDDKDSLDIDFDDNEIKLDKVTTKYYPGSTSKSISKEDNKIYPLQVSTSNHKEVRIIIESDTSESDTDHN